MGKKSVAFRETRLENVLDIIRSQDGVLVSDLAEKFDVSPSTIRLDLGVLEDRSLITRTHGGALLRKEFRLNLNAGSGTITERSDLFRPEKKAIGRAAASLIEDGDTLLIDGGSTTSCVVDFLLEKKHLTVITNSLIIMQKMYLLPTISLYMLGGMSFSKHGVTIGPMTNEALKKFSPSKTILGIDGLSVEKGLMAADPATPAIASVKVDMVKISTELIVVCDHSKLNHVCPMTIAPIEAMDYLVTDQYAPDSIVRSIRSRGPQVIVAKIE